MARTVTVEPCLLCVPGPHAGEEEGEMWKGMQAKAERFGRVFWHVVSHKARVEAVRTLAPKRCYFLEPSSKGAAKMTSSCEAADEYMADREWTRFLPGEAPTGRLTPSSSAVVFTRITFLTEDIRPVLDLWKYAEAADNTAPVRFMPGTCMQCVVPSDTMASHPKRTKSHLRKVVAIGELAEPFAVSLRRAVKRSPTPQPAETVAKKEKKAKKPGKGSSASE
eukprot:Sspe_Gene.56244::Locus_30949_Transcript_1_1_Confidence_1.000_Length_1303::g.56244::m.56244